MHAPGIHTRDADEQTAVGEQKEFGGGEAQFMGQEGLEV